MTQISIAITCVIIAHIKHLFRFLIRFSFVSGLLIASTGATASEIIKVASERNM